MLKKFSRLPLGVRIYRLVMLPFHVWLMPIRGGERLKSMPMDAITTIAQFFSSLLTIQAFYLPILLKMTLVDGTASEAAKEAHRFVPWFYQGGSDITRLLPQGLLSPITNALSAGTGFGQLVGKFLDAFPIVNIFFGTSPSGISIWKDNQTFQAFVFAYVLAASVCVCQGLLIRPKPFDWLVAMMNKHGSRKKVNIPKDASPLAKHFGKRAKRHGSGLVAARNIVWLLTVGGETALVLLSTMTSAVSFNSIEFYLLLSAGLGQAVAFEAIEYIRGHILITEGPAK